MASTQKKILVLTGMIVAVLCFVTGILIGWLLIDPQLSSEPRGTSSFNDTTSSSAQRHGSDVSEEAEPAGAGGGRRKACPAESDLQEADPGVSDRLLQLLLRAPVSMESHLRFLSERPHVAGTEGDERVVEYIRQELQNMGYRVDMYPYDVTLSYPVKNHFNKVSVLDGRGRAIATLGLRASTGSPWDKDLVRPYCLYSPSAKVQGKLVYANYGRPQDFKVLEMMGVNTSRAIVLMRHGKQTSAKMVREAAKRGAAGVILYNDPADHNMTMISDVYPHTSGGVVVPEGVYPHTWWLPGDGVEHSNARLPWGDPATPGYASTEGAYRVGEKQMELPEIPCHPVAYADAKSLLQILDGPAAPEDWQGQLDVQYRLAEKKSGATPVELSVRNVLESRRIHNVVATLTGATEQDRVVIVGNHHDAIAYGGVDPGSGTAAMLEIASAFARLAKEGWRPRRTLMFCSWAAKEFGLIGSTEWVEEKRRWLNDHVVAYLNLDAVLQGNYTLDISATPSMQGAIIRAAGKVPDPLLPERTVLDTWTERVPDKRAPGQPWIRRPTYESDQMPFMNLLGVPVVDSRYTFVMEEGGVTYGLRHFPLQRTAYDTGQLALMVDKGLGACRTVAALVAELARDLADSLLLPLSPRHYALGLKAHLHRPLERAADRANQSVVQLLSSLDTFLNAANVVESRVKESQSQINSLSVIKIRQLNDILMMFEREFVDQSTGTHVFMIHGGNSNPTLDVLTMTKMIQALNAATASLLSAVQTDKTL